METIGVVAEFNPFHNGHHYLLQEIRKRCGADCRIVIIMSGSFVQRGEPAFFDKWRRTRWALRNGADCVIELPAVYALSHADGFASGAIRLARALGCTALACGVEQGTADDFLTLGKGALSLSSLTVNDHSGQPYGQYLTTALQEKFPREGQLLASPNALLATAYAKAIMQYAPSLHFIPIHRRGQSHDMPGLTTPFASATAIRQALCQGAVDTLSQTLPSSIYGDVQHAMATGAYTDYDRYDDFVVYVNRFTTTDQLRTFPAFSEGLENRWHRIFETAPTWAAALSALKTRRYAYSRLCRMGAYTVLSISRDIMTASLQAGPQYARILGFTKRGQGLLKERKGAIPIITKATTGRHVLTPLGQKQLAIDIAATDVQALCFKTVPQRKGKKDFLTSPQILSQEDI